MVREGSDRDLDRESLRAVTIKLEALFSEVPTGRLDLAWKLRRKGGK